MEFVSRKELEEFVLKKYDQTAVEILYSVPLAAVYVYDNIQNKWKQLRCEGVLFLYRKIQEPCYSLFLLNRINNLHFYQPLNEKLKLQIEDSFLLFKNDDGSIFAVWVYESHIYVKIFEEIKNILHNINLKFLCGMATNRRTNKMLQKSDEEYIKTRHSLRYLDSEICESSNLTSSSVTKFFEDAHKVIKSNESAISLIKNSHDDNYVFKNIIHNPEYNVKSIEKNQRFFL